MSLSAWQARKYRVEVRNYKVVVSVQRYAYPDRNFAKMAEI
jgi:hypothetical protein